MTGHDEIELEYVGEGAALNGKAEDYDKGNETSGKDGEVAQAENDSYTSKDAKCTSKLKKNLVYRVKKQNGVR